MKQLNRTSADTTAYFLNDLEILLGTKNPIAIWNHPDRNKAFAEVAQYRHRKSRTIELRIGTLCDVINGKAKKSIDRHNRLYVKGAVMAGALTDQQFSAAIDGLANAQ